MTSIRRGLDLLIDLVGVVAWGFAAFVLASHFVSRSAGPVFGIALAIAALAWAISTHVQDSRMHSLAAGRCPRCKQVIGSEHRHRRWEPSRSEWLQPVTSWECKQCGYGHSETWVCPGCPDAA